MRTFRIFLSSPGDCEAERTAAFLVVESLNADPVIAQFARLEIVAWDWGPGVPFDALASPQVSVNSRMPVPEECDVYIGIFRCRFGSPIPINEFRKDDGTSFRSGSEYEFDRAWKARRLGAKTPEIYVYRLQDPDTTTCDAEQLSLLNAFFDAAPFKAKGQWIGSLNRFQDTADFEGKLEGHLKVILSKSHPSAKLRLQEWLERKALQLEHDAGPRYTRATHVESDVRRVFNWLLVRSSAIEALDKILSEIWEELDAPEFESIKAAMQRIASCLRENWNRATPPDFDFIERTLTRIAETAAQLEHATELDDSGETLSGNMDLDKLQEIKSLAMAALRDLKKFLAFAQRRVLLLAGPAGQGKTHTLVHEVRSVLASGGIAIGALAQTLPDATDLRGALIKVWGYGESSFDELLDTLENAAAQSGQRALIVIDALNETPNRTRWKNELNGIVRDIVARPHLTLALSVRSDYRMHVLPELDPQQQPWVEHQHAGFAGIEPNALRAYFIHYGIKAPVAPLIGELSNPLYVQLLVKSLMGRTTPSHWLPSWLEVWGAWIERLEADARNRFTLDPSRRQPVRRSLNKMAAAMIVSGKFNLLRSEADSIAHTTTGIEGLVGFLCSAGALMDRIEDDDDIVEFGFERLSDTFIADRLLHQLFEGKNDVAQKRGTLETALAPGGVLAALAAPGENHEPLASRRSGLLAALCLAVPKLAGVELPNLLPLEPDEDGWFTPDMELRMAVTDSMRWRCAPDEFAGGRGALWKMYRRRGAFFSGTDDLDELIRLALIPGHPFAMEHYLHRRLRRMRSPGARDACWTVKLISPWSNDGSNLSGLVRWAKDSDLAHVGDDLALAAVRILAWSCASSQQQLRESATCGLTRLLVACPSVLPRTLADFLPVNDDYVLESVLAATWGVLIDSRDRNSCMQAARQVYGAIFARGTPHCHLTIRHYARRIVEVACDRGWVDGIDRSIIEPPYKSSLPLALVPTKDSLRALDRSKGFGSILGSALGRDFFWYVMGATSGTKHFTSEPLPHSLEPVRFYCDEESQHGSRAPSGIFDIPLAARFVVWNCLQLGWTTERFNEFDTGPETQGYSRIERSGRTERIGKKYQWIGWQTMLAFLSDNYRMTSGSARTQRTYDTPHQIGYIEVFDPSRWLHVASHASYQSLNDTFWRMPCLPQWPMADDEDLQRWGDSEAFDLPAIDIINHVPPLPEHWGEGPWIRVAAENIWKRPAIPGMWPLGQEQDIDIWWQITPGLIQSADLPRLLEALELPEVQGELGSVGRIDLQSNSDVQLVEWPSLKGEFDTSLTDPKFGYGAWLPVPWMQLAGECGDPDRSDEEGPVILPLPRVFRDWGLSLDLQHGVVRHDDTVVFGIVGRAMGEDALVARRDILMDLLTRHDMTLVWWLRGERKAVVRESLMDFDCRVWIDSHGVAFLAQDGRAQVAWLGRAARDMHSGE
ncbi:hypothetical protein PSCICO_31600 [Pseudomonas cichorii]|uniref:ATP-binding protein n=1 Tax=Pseudomonas cichorii TaxID=36746 RepID=UPI0019107466|nr:ATP-binding protein [Pseudomonas cichorii]GFM87761.1 hypothetical protein PSCICO_31600 [Pseudomonas cichorii]